MKTFWLSAFLLMGGLALGKASVEAPPADLTVYSGRSKAALDPLVQHYQARTGLKINVVYANDRDLTARLQQEKTSSPADLFISNTFSTIGTLESLNLFSKLNPSLTTGVHSTWLPASQKWTPLALKFRVLAYNRDVIKPEQLPENLLDLSRLQPYKGRIGWAPLDAGFQEILGLLVETQGMEKARIWLDQLLALELQDYGSGNTGMMEDLGNGTIDVAFSQHILVQRFQRAGYHVASAFFKAGDAGNLMDGSAAAVLKAGKHQAQAFRFLKYLLNSEAQAFTLSVNFEYPVIAALPYPATLVPYAQVAQIVTPLNPADTSKRVQLGQQLLQDAGVM
ncbi:extracellular solute-binding protein [Deinococcus roseus]|uniref:Iron ABC transporter substrate-binding protein n=1 Tax=Deinococcus roseus TaxID=392414 RepID=A0ABQ2CXW9_9DEIO|nr:extracellular solute-binding protein [Deinococcus roseus]GGJ31782.1 iron ABC transporter substrate-binding protein [Deinococcus roseus]